MSLKHISTVTLKAGDGFSSFTFTTDADPSAIIKALKGAKYVDYAWDEDSERYEFVQNKHIRVEFASTEAWSEYDHQEFTERKEKAAANSDN